MVIMLFLFILLIFPIKLGAKLYFLPKEGYLTIKFFLYRIFILSIHIFATNGKIYFKLGKKRPSEFLIDFSTSQKTTIPYNPFKIMKLKIFLQAGGNPTVVTTFSFFFNFFGKVLATKFKNIKVDIYSLPSYYKQEFSLKSKLVLYTSLLAVIYALVLI